MSPPPCSIRIAVPPGFDLSRAVCSYGYFMLAPNHWDPATRSFCRPLRGARDRLIRCTITQPRTARRGRAAPHGRAVPHGRTSLLVRTDRALSPADRPLLAAQITRMLRLDADLAPWHRLHPAARRARFDRLFRSPSLFEDIVKTITGCNVTWPNTMRMNRLLCEQVGTPGTRGTPGTPRTPGGGGGFPTAGQLAAVSPAWLKAHCKVGYRAGRIVQLARDVVSGRLDLAALEDPALGTDELLERLLEIHGIGPYAAANILQLLGRYDRLAIDSETYRHFRQVHQVKTPRTSAGLRRLHRRIERHYARFAPYQFLAYWFELWTGYQGRVGDARTWEAAKHGPEFTAANLG